MDRHPVGPANRAARVRPGLLAATVVSLLLCSSQAVAQVPQVHRPTFWVSAAFGPTRPYDWAAVGVAGVRYARVIVRVRNTITFENPGGRIDDFGVLTGVVVTPPSRRGHVSVGAGAGRVRQVYNCFLCSGSTFPARMGLLVDAEGRLALVRGVGLTAYAFGDVNSGKSFVGLAIGLFVGGL